MAKPSKLEFWKQLLVCEPTRHPGARLGARGHAKTGVVTFLVRPHMCGRNRQADANIVRRDVEHHEILRQREWPSVMLADLAFDLCTGIEVVEEMVDDGEPRLDQCEHLSGFLGRGMR